MMQLVYSRPDVRRATGANNLPKSPQQGRAVRFEAVRKPPLVGMKLAASAEERLAREHLDDTATWGEQQVSGWDVAGLIETGSKLPYKGFLGRLYKVFTGKLPEKGYVTDTQLKEALGDTLYYRFYNNLQTLQKQEFLTIELSGSEWKMALTDKGLELLARRRQQEGASAALPAQPMTQPEALKALLSLNAFGITNWTVLKRIDALEQRNNATVLARLFSGEGASKKALAEVLRADKPEALAQILETLESAGFLDAEAMQSGRLQVSEKGRELIAFSDQDELVASGKITPEELHQVLELYLNEQKSEQGEHSRFLAKLQRDRGEVQERLTALQTRQKDLNREALSKNNASLARQAMTLQLEIDSLGEHLTQMDLLKSAASEEASRREQAHYEEIVRLQQAQYKARLKSRLREYGSVFQTETRDEKQTYDAVVENIEQATAGSMAETLGISGNEQELEAKLAFKRLSDEQLLRKLREKAAGQQEVKGAKEGGRSFEANG